MEVNLTSVDLSLYKRDVIYNSNRRCSQCNSVWFWAIFNTTHCDEVWPKPTLHHTLVLWSHVRCDLMRYTMCGLVDFWLIYFSRCHGQLLLSLSLSIYIYIYINRQNLEKVQLKFEIRIQFCAMYLNLCRDYTIIIHLSLCHMST